MFLLFAFPLVFLIFARLPRIGMTVTDHSSVKQNETKFFTIRTSFEWNSELSNVSLRFLFLMELALFERQAEIFERLFFSFKNVWHLNDTVWYLKNLKVV